MADMAIFQVQGPDSVMQSGASPGSSVGDTNDWILFLWFILIVFFVKKNGGTPKLVVYNAHTILSVSAHILELQPKFKVPRKFVPRPGSSADVESDLPATRP